MARKGKENINNDMSVVREEDSATDMTAPNTAPSAAAELKKGRRKRNSSMPEWFKLDNAANVYPAIMTKDWNAVYRISIMLTEEINPAALQQAAEDLRPRFPTFYVQVRKGFFWYYLDPTGAPTVEKESRYPCRPFAVGVGNKPLFRLFYYKDKISFEAFHSVTDGTGALSYVNTLLYRYLQICGKEMGDTTGVLDYRDDPSDAELEDSFHRYYRPVKTKNRIESRAWQYKGRPSLDSEFFRIVKVNLSVEELKRVTKAKGVSITQYLSALLIYSLGQTRKNPSKRVCKRPIRLCVPINLRKHFPSVTLRNFSLFANVGLPVTPETTLDDVIASVVPQITENFKKDCLQETFSMNVKPEKNKLLRIVPLAIKSLVLGIIGRQLGDTRVSAALSNLGPVDLPPSLKPYVKEVITNLGPSYINGMNVTISTIDDRMTIVFSSPFPSTEVQAFFCRHLAENGVKLEVESNV